MTNSLMKLTNEKGEPFIMNEQAKERCKYYLELFMQPVIHSAFQPWFPRVVTQSMNIWLSRIPRNDEIKKFFDQLNALKALGPNGFTMKIFQKCWENVKHDMEVELSH